MERLIQITDTHLMQDPDAELMGVNTRQSLKTVLQHIRAHHPDFDAMICSGDLTQDGSEAGYRALRDQLSVFDQPIHCLPGNHDDVETMRSVLNENGVCCIPSAKFGHWHIIYLNSTVSGQVGGTISKAELTRLNDEVSALDDEHVLCFLHHQPIPIGCDWLDTQIVSNHEALMAVLQSSDRIRAVAWGHVHQEHDSLLGSLRLLSTPSTCGQFKPGCHDFSMDELPPGYRWFELHADGSVETGVERV